MPLHQFSADRRQLRQAWFDLCETLDLWEECGPIGEGESCPIRVRNSTIDLMGAAKPGPCKAAETSHCRAAHEKIAYDLAYLLDLPVQPVVLWPEKAPSEYKRGRSIAAWTFEDSMNWKEADAKGLMSPTQKESAGPIFSAMRVFHSWISDLDRNTGQVRVNMASRGTALELAFFDHSNSMSYIWASPDTVTPNLPTASPMLEARDVLIATAAQINGLPDAQIERIVTRIKDPYLPKFESGNIISNLLSRKGQLREILRLE